MFLLGAIRALLFMCSSIELAVWRLLNYASGMFEVCGTHFEKGVFEIHLEKTAPRPLSWFLGIGQITGRVVGLILLAFSFLFSTSRAPMQFMLERGMALNPEAAFKTQQEIGYVFFFIAVLFYMTVFFFRPEKMFLIFNKGTKLFAVEHEPLFRFSSTKRGHVPFQDLQKVEKVLDANDVQAPFGKLVLRSDKMPNNFKKIEFAVLSSEQFEYFPLNIERLMD